MEVFFFKFAIQKNSVKLLFLIPLTFVVSLNNSQANEGFQIDKIEKLISLQINKAPEGKQVQYFFSPGIDTLSGDKKLQEFANKFYHQIEYLLLNGKPASLDLHNKMNELMPEEDKVKSFFYSKLKKDSAFQEQLSTLNSYPGFEAQKEKVKEVGLDSVQSLVSRFFYITNYHPEEGWQVTICLTNHGFQGINKGSRNLLFEAFIWEGIRKSNSPEGTNPFMIAIEPTLEELNNKYGETKLYEIRKRFYQKLTKNKQFRNAVKEVYLFGD